MTLSAPEFAANSFLGNIGAPLHHSPLGDSIAADEPASRYMENIDLEVIDIVDRKVR